jgi:type III restriction enzyme
LPEFEGQVKCICIDPPCNTGNEGWVYNDVDFIVKTKSGRIIVLETKGDDRDSTDSELKLNLGKLWEAKTGRLPGSGFHYMMVFENNPVDGAERPADTLAKIRQL